MSNFSKSNILKSISNEGIIHLERAEPLAAYPEKITERLIDWANEKPTQTFLARRDATQVWQRLSYADTLLKVKNIAQYILNQQIASDRTIAILSENSLEHALLALGAMYCGVLYSPISVAYSLMSDDLGKLEHCLLKMTPKLIFAQDGEVYKNALTLARKMFPDATIVCVKNTLDVDFQELITTKASEVIENAHQNVTKDTVAKILFTSGSTGLPKGVINTQGMWCANLQQITQSFPCMTYEPPVFVDWLPWNHTFGGNHNFGLVLYNGGTLYIDDGKPTPKGIATTVQNLREIAPTAYFNVPKGFEMLLPFFEKEPDLRTLFFKNLTFLFYAGASLAQPIWDSLEDFGKKTVGRVVPIMTGLGCTESGPSALFANWEGCFSGLLGVPVAGMHLKLVPDNDKLEIRYKAPNVTPGYWRDAIATENAFDQEGYYKTGDAVRFLDDNDPNKGLLFDGRIAEDFKLSTGTWVNVGVLKAKVVAQGAPIVQDVVIGGLDRDYVSILLFLNLDVCRIYTNSSEEATRTEVFTHPKINEFVHTLLQNLNKTATGSASRIAKAVVTIEPPSIALGEITDKGSINQRMVLKYRGESLY
jgi:feruloyl-CoA synthase